MYPYMIFLIFSEVEMLGLEELLVELLVYILLAG